MSFNIKIFLLCPIPEGQKPINEYISLKDNFLTNLLTFKDKKKYIQFYSFLLFFFFFLLDTNNFHLNLPKIVSLTIFLTNLIVLIFSISIFNRWKNLENRFNNSRIVYEEGSWYDAQIWEKPFLLIKNDRLILNQKIIPVLQQLLGNIFNLVLFNFFLLFYFFII
jgi:hypothetical protein